MSQAAKLSAAVWGITPSILSVIFAFAKQSHLGVYIGNWLTNDATVLVYKSSVKCPGSSPDYAMIEHSKFETVSGMEGDNCLLLARTLALSDDNFFIIMLYKFLSKSLFFLLSLFFLILFPFFLFPFLFFLSFFWSLRGGAIHLSLPMDPPLP